MYNLSPKLFKSIYFKNLCIAYEEFNLLKINADTLKREEIKYYKLLYIILISFFGFVY